MSVVVACTFQSCHSVPGIGAHSPWLSQQYVQVCMISIVGAWPQDPQELLSVDGEVETSGFQAPSTLSDPEH